MAVPVPPCPQSLKSIQHYLKIASDHDSRDIVVAYWCRLFAMQTGLKIDKTSPEAKQLLFFLIDWLEKCKTQHKENDSLTNEVAAQAYLENYALKLFNYADSQDRACVFNKGIIKAFYTSGIIYDVLEIFGELTEEVTNNRKYAKWKASYLNNCLKTGETPIHGPIKSEEEEEENDINTMPGPSGNIGFAVPPAQPPQQPSNSSPFERHDYSNPVQPTLPLPPNIPPTSTYSHPEPAQTDSLSSNNSTSSLVGPELISKAQKYCKFASSALNYEDIPTAVLNLQKALTLLQTGNEA